MNLDPNFYNLQGYSHGRDGMNLHGPTVAGINQECYNSYVNGWLEGLKEHQHELLECDDPEKWVDSIDEQHIDEIDNGDDYDWGDDEDCEPDFFDDDQGQYDDDPSPYSGY